LCSLFDDIVKVQLVVVNAYPQGNNEIAPTKERIIQVQIAQQIQILARVKLTDICMKSADFRLERIQRNGFA